MNLYLNGQDIHALGMCVFTNTLQPSNFEKKNVSPEEYLKALELYLQSHQLTLDTIKRCFVVVGPGSATALRSCLALANTLAFTKGVGLVPVRKERDEQDLYTIEKLLEHDLSTLPTQNVLTPIYEHEPRITMSTKDALRRKHS